MFPAILIILLLMPAVNFGATIKGLITDENDHPLSYATVFLKNTSLGTTANADGVYSFEVPAGDYEIVFRYVGYKSVQEKITVGSETVIKNVRLQPESFSLNEVVVDASAEDPAYDIIRHAEAKRQYYLNRVRAYSCNVYIKGVQSLDSIPDKIMGIKASKLHLDSSRLGIIYLSESESQYNYEQPGKVKEIVYSSKVSGNNNSFSWNSAAAFNSNFYENLIPLEGITPRGLVSPIAAGAFTFYRYKLLGTFYDDGFLINKIQVIPKRRNDPVFSGTIYIVEDQWCIHSLNLLVTKDAHLDFVDSLRITETYGLVNDTAWMPFNQVLQFNVSILGFKGPGSFIGVFSNYNLQPQFGKNFFDAVQLQVNSNANKKDSLYWAQRRPVPLTTSERSDYHNKDSIYLVHSSKPYLDSVDHEQNKLRVQNILLGYSYQNSYRHFQYLWHNPLLGLNFNTVEGLNLTVRNSFQRDHGEMGHAWNLNADGRYGFSNRKFSAQGSFTYQNDPFHNQRWLLQGGSFPTQPDAAEPINEPVNTLYSLLSQQNFMKLYENRYGSFSQQREWFNGFDLTASVTYADRLPLQNSTDYSFAWLGDRAYDPNNFFENTLADSLTRTQALTLDLKAAITIGEKYEVRPDRKFSRGSKFPTFVIEYRKGIPAWGSDVDYDLLQLSTSYDFKAGLAGHGTLSVSGGAFLRNQALSLIDFRHFNSNQTLFGVHYADGFQLLPYYSASTDHAWLEGHYEHHFGGFILNKIPLIKKLGLQEVVGLHALLTPDMHYMELDAGIEHLFKVLRFDFVTSLGADGKINTGFRIGLSLVNGAITVE